MKIAIVTGANGFVGGATVKELAANNYKVYAVVRNGNADRLQGVDNIKIVNCELSQINELPNLIPERCNVFYHFAWSGSAGSDRADTRLQLDNVQWSVECIRSAKKLGCARFVFAGSIIEKESLAAAYTGGNRPGLGYIYGGGKVAAHILCSSVAAAEGIDLIWGEITNAYGVGEVSPRLVNSTIRKCLAGKSPEFTAGTQNYDFVYIDDVARAFRLIGENGKPFTSYVIGSSHAKPLKEFLLEMKQAVAPNLPFKFGDMPFTGINLPLTDFDCSKTEKDTGFKADISFAEGCKRTYNWWKERLKNEH